MTHLPAEVRAAPKHREPPGQGRGYNHLEPWRPVATPYRGDEASQKLKIQTIPFRLFLLKNALKETQWTLSVQKAHAAVNKRNYDITMNHRH